MSETRLEFSRSVFPDAPVWAEDLRYIVSCLRGKCCSVVGPSNTGKSILLRSLLAEEVRQSCAPGEAGPPLMVFVDCLDAGETEQGFYKLVLRRIIEELEGSVVSRATVDNLKALHRGVLRNTSAVAVRSLFASSMRELGREGKIGLMLILDEFDMGPVLAPDHRHDDDGPAVHIHIFHREVEGRIGIVGDGLDDQLSGRGADLYTQDCAILAHAEEHVTAVGVGHGSGRPGTCL